MSNEEIIEELNHIADDFENERLDTTEWVAYEYDPDEAAEAVRAGAEAKEYRTPKEVVTHGLDPGVVWWSCPTCNKYLERFSKYCPECGQALDWSEVI